MALRNNKLEYKYKSRRTSNHAIGSRVQELAAAIDWNNDGVADIVVPDAGRQGLKVFSYAKRGKPELLETISLSENIVTAMVATDMNKDNKPELVFGLASGKLMVLNP